MSGELSIFWDERVLQHDTGYAFGEAPPSDLLDVQEKHVENAERLVNMRSVLQRGPLADRLDWRDGRLATVAEIETAHPRAYIDGIEAFIAGGGGFIEENTVLSEGSWPGLLAAVGTSIEATDAVLSGSVDRAYALVRPPGHHAQPEQAEGYGVFNHAAIMAERALASGLKRVAIIDWDTHHGNGTQEFFYRRSDVLYISFHMRHGSWSATHPQTGSAAEIGVGEGAGFNVNIELPLASGDAAYEAAWHAIVTPILEQYDPELLILSSGQDASAFDPNGRQCLTMAGFHRLGTLSREAADALTGGRFVAVQEGGYHLSYAAYCLHATCEGFLGLDPMLEDPIGYLPDDPHHADSGISLVHTYLSRFWRFPR
jgi:acetoin utilization deacetylase AcuC-like enzyme